MTQVQEAPSLAELTKGLDFDFIYKEIWPGVVEATKIYEEAVTELDAELEVDEWKARFSERALPICQEHVDTMLEIVGIETSPETAADIYWDEVQQWPVGTRYDGVSMALAEWLAIEKSIA